MSDPMEMELQAVMVAQCGWQEWNMDQLEDQKNVNSGTSEFGVSSIPSIEKSVTGQQEDSVGEGTSYQD